MSSRWGPQALAITLALVAACAPAEPPPLALPPLRDAVAFPAPTVAREARPSQLELERELLRTRGEDDAARLRRIQLRLVREGKGDLDAALAESEALRAPALRAAARGAIHLLLDQPRELFADAGAVLGRELAPCTELLPLPPPPAPEDAPALEVLRANLELARRRLGFVPEPGVKAAREPLDLRRREMILATIAMDSEALPRGYDELATELAAEGDELLLEELAFLRTPGAFGPAELAARRRLRELEERSPRAADRGALIELGATAEPFVALRALALAMYESILSGDHAAARTLAARIEARCTRLGCLLERALARSDLGSVLQREGALADAEQHFLSALELLPVSFATRRLEVQSKYATSASWQGRSETAHARRAAVIRGYQALGMFERAAEALAAVADDAPPEQLALAAAAACVARDTFDGDGFGHGELAVARLEQASGRHEAALARARGARAKIGARSLMNRHVAALDVEIEALLSLRRWDDAAAAHEERTALPGTVSHNRAVLEAVLRARIEEGRGRPAAAMPAWQRALELEEALLVRATRPTDRRGLEGNVVDKAFELARAAALAARAPTELAPGERTAVAATGLARAATALFGPAAPPAGTCELAARFAHGRLSILTRSDAGVRLDLQARDGGALGRSADDSAAAKLAAWVGPVIGADRCPDGTRHVQVSHQRGTLAGPLVQALQAAREAEATFDARFALPPAGLAVLPRAALIVLAPERSAGASAAPPLPGAEQELAALTEAFPASKVLRGADATPEALLEGLRDTALVHVAVHASAEHRDAVATRLLLAGPSGELAAPRVSSARVAEGAIILLASCGTSGQPESPERDGGGLPWALLSAGAALVIAHESDLPDETSVQFSRAFYGALARGTSPELAAESARSAVERASGRPAAARFVVYRR